MPLTPLVQLGDADETSDLPVIHWLWRSDSGRLDSLTVRESQQKKVTLSSCYSKQTFKTLYWLATCSMPHADRAMTLKKCFSGHTPTQKKIESSHYNAQKKKLEHCSYCVMLKNQDCWHSDAVTQHEALSWAGSRRFTTQSRFNPFRAIHTWIRRIRRIHLHKKGWFSICQVWQ